MRDESPTSLAGDYLKTVIMLNVPLSFRQDKGTFFIST